MSSFVPPIEDSVINPGECFFECSPTFSLPFRKPRRWQRGDIDRRPLQACADSEQKAEL